MTAESILRECANADYLEGLQMTFEKAIDIWAEMYRRILEEHRKFPGICGECVFAATCRTACVAQNYVDGRHLVWPDVLCAEAAERGLFPASRRKPGR